MADMATHYGWWILAVVLGITELFVGSFYLLVIAVALALAGLSAWLGATFSIQLLVAAVASALGAGLVRYLRPIAPSQQAPERNPDLNLDIGQTVTVDGWEDNGQTRINYRGTIWQAELLSGYPRRIGTHRIHAIAGSRLVLIPVELARATGRAGPCPRQPPRRRSTARAGRQSRKAHAARAERLSCLHPITILQE